MKLFTALFIILSSSAAWAQNDVVRAEYYFDNDPGFNQGVQVTTGFTPAQDVTIGFTADISALTPGFHVFYVRAKNDSGWSLPISKPFLKENASYLDALSDIVSAEYFIDADPGFRYGTHIEIADNPDATSSFSVDLSAVSAGFHVLYVRALDSHGLWSHVESRPFLKESISFQDPVANMQSLEYYMDADPGFGHGTTVSLSSSPDVQQSFIADLSPVTPGFHVLYIRAKDASGIWSHVLARPFLKESTSFLDAAADVNAVEYYIDTDPGFGLGNGIVVTTSPDLTRSFTASLAGLSPGFHVLYVRSRDANGIWSLTTSRPFLMESDPAGNIVAVEYYYRKHGANSATFTRALIPGTDVTANFLASPSTLQADSVYEMHVRAVDAAGQKSLELIHNFTAKSGGLPNKLPYRERAISDRVLNEDFDSTTIALLDTVFYDSNLIFGIDSLRYTVSAGSAIVSGAVTQNRLKLSSLSDLNGSTQIVVTAMDDSSVATRDTFTVTITPVNDAPVVYRNLTDTTIHLNFLKTFRTVLTSAFQDIDNATLTYSVSNLTSGAGAVISNDSLYITSVFGFTGTASFRVAATDNLLSVADTFKVTITDAAPLGLSTSIHQNAALSKYADVYVIADSPLLTVPSVKLFIGLDSSSAVPMSLLSGQTYKGAIQFTQNGTYEIRSQGFAVSGAYFSDRRSFAAGLAKPGIVSSLSSVDGRARLLIGKSAVSIPTYFMAEEEMWESEKVYRWGPSGQLQQPVELYLKYDENAFDDAGKLFVAQWIEGSWIPLESRVNTTTAEIRTKTKTLGQFKILYDPSYSGSNILPTEFALNQNYPNPFNPSTSIVFDLPQDGEMSLKIYNILGQQVKILLHEFKPAGRYTIQWDGRNESGVHAASGIYLYRMQSRDFVKTRKMILIK